MKLFQNPSTGLGGVVVERFSIFSSGGHPFNGVELFELFW